MRSCCERANTQHRNTTHIIYKRRCEKWLNVCSPSGQGTYIRGETDNASRLKEAIVRIYTPVLNKNTHYTYCICRGDVPPHIKLRSFKSCLEIKAIFLYVWCTQLRKTERDISPLSAVWRKQNFAVHHSPYEWHIIISVNGATRRRMMMKNIVNNC